MQKSFANPEGTVRLMEIRACGWEVGGYSCEYLLICSLFPAQDTCTYMHSFYYHCAFSSGFGIFLWKERAENAENKWGRNWARPYKHLYRWEKETCPVLQGPGIFAFHLCWVQQCSFTVLLLLLFMALMVSRVTGINVNKMACDSKSLLLCYLVWVH